MKMFINYKVEKYAVAHLTLWTAGFHPTQLFYKSNRKYCSKCMCISYAAAFV